MLVKTFGSTNFTMSKFDRDFVRRHARPGESWENAHGRLRGEILARHASLPFCPSCAKEFGPEWMEHHKLRACLHSLGECDWPKSFVSERTHNLTTEFYSDMLSFQGHLIATRILDDLAQLEASRDVPINLVMLAARLRGLFDACDLLGLDLSALGLTEARERLEEINETARQQTIEQVRSNDPNLLPWR